MALKNAADTMDDVRAAAKRPQALRQTPDAASGVTVVLTSCGRQDLLEEVAEDYVTKPYHYPELRARINRVLRRLGDKVPRQSLVLGPDLTLDLHRREATEAVEVEVQVEVVEGMAMMIQIRKEKAKDLSPR